ncbi:hypothetical protein OIE66_06865 [Nonomuraea sp. NBC_01738]|uniref:hypothetical protein n=1 Tax=Nonomuraea sp. NBC_01738 TaxID=2976003 RepID=UPI002E148977|nr:hypothetical protein OIE66_06865 [Nonomuraea sp. NBC_01738]
MARIAAASLDLGDLPQALAHAELAATIDKEIGHPFITGLALTQLGRALDGLGERARATGCLQEAYDLFSALGVPEATQLEALIRS